MYRYKYIKGIYKGQVVDSQDAYPEGEIAGGEHFPRMGILPVIDGKKKQDSHRWASSQEVFDSGERPEEAQGCHVMVEKMKFPTIATPQAPELVGGTN